MNYTAPKPVTSSTGGVITYPAPGVLRHTASNGAYSGRIAAVENKPRG